MIMKILTSIQMQSIALTTIYFLYIMTFFNVKKDIDLKYSSNTINLKYSLSTLICLIAALFLCFRDFLVLNQKKNYDVDLIKTKFFSEDYFNLSIIILLIILILMSFLISSYIFRKTKINFKLLFLTSVLISVFLSLTCVQQFKILRDLYFIGSLVFLYSNVYIIFRTFKSIINNLKFKKYKKNSFYDKVNVVGTVLIGLHLTIILTFFAIQLL